MDQLKEILGVLRRQHFWFIAPLLLVTGLAGWIMANKKLTAEFDTNSKAVNGYISQMATVSSQDPHPNAEYEKGMQELIAQRRENVRAAWTRKWEQQKQKLRWPRKDPSKPVEEQEGLNPQFVAAVEPLRPIEKNGVKAELHSQDRQMYAGYVRDQLPKLAERIGARWQPASSSRSSLSIEGFRSTPRSPQSRAPSRRDAVEEPTAVVNWDPENQADIEARFDWGTQGPTTLQVLYAQEDLWVLSHLIDIIQRTNGDAKIRSLAPIKDIEFIKIAQDVNPPSQQGFQVIRPTPSGVEPQAGGGSGPSTEAEDFGTNDRTAAGEEAAPEILDETAAPPSPLLDLVKNRYYDMHYQPITDLDSASLKVAKRIPVRLRVRMDQRKIPDLLAECANADLTFEVRQLRFNPQGDSPAGTTGRALANAQAYGQPSGSKTKQLDPNDYPTLDRTVELFGFVYIFNPVDDAVLRGEVPTDQPPPEDAATLPADPRRDVRLAMSR